MTATNYERVMEFHRVYGLKVGVWPHYDPDSHCLRTNLMQEEFNEVVEAMESGDVAAIAKELADLLYVVYGTGVTFGMDMDAVFAEVHDSNMSKLGEDGKPITREDGKILKGPAYRQADVAATLGLAG